ncbi:Geranylgeranyl pyrophosphate synthase 4 [Neochlamydia sp. TUME1]|uniref:polyprenyl synthetase family protein n=1 Tax=Neochlamydia sp. TUME1 TaxID=1478174 RepID=UPI00058251AA|nr:polyprenyl synthetase family protein [Neochlamydia sp. TUME1]KIC72110.1 Geranylgeranyl pyrophosphate synthase 4 [Neochlamydia sp. TUME1]
MIKNDPFSYILAPYQLAFESSLRQAIALLGPKTNLRDVCEYALMNGGKRFRPFLVLVIAKALKAPVDVSFAALAVEFFHTASLLADDLPCMDNDDVRRDKPSAHKVYGESLALLASYALIASGYEFLAKNAKVLSLSGALHAAQSDRICLLALENCTFNTGLLGATGGQFLDIYPPDLSINTLKEIIRMKTGSLFEISFVLGWLYGGGALDKLADIKKAAYHFGMAFQIADDFGDVEQDAHQGKLVNLVAKCGREDAFKMFLEEIEAFKVISQQLNLDVPELSTLCDLLTSQINSEKVE